ncbi:MAG TPA: FemAB family XrtA/PEP-CTERM system-associated protein [Gemmatimonadales bacterium]|jgi:FemAB-related protein (PEP-CTERM system-associated)|nr:FemAB family XrtA/PEP-CTERM system-associated protein [Gemmatimonadales bacterium]
MTIAPPPPSIEVVPLNGEVGAWDELVTRAGGSSFCHLAGWRDILSEVLGAECLYRVAVDREGAWHGILPLARVRSKIFGHYLVSLPFLNDGGPLGSPAAQDRLVADAVGEARRARADLLELRTRNVADLELPVSTHKITVLLPLPPDADALFARFPAKLRSQIRRPRKEGLVARFGPDQREPFYEVFARTMRDLGTPVMPRAFFERVATTFAELVVFGVVYHGDQPVSGGCGFVWRDEFEMTWAGSLREARGLSANMLLYWAFMEHVIGRGVRVFNFGRCTPEGGTHRFKKQWGGVDVPLPWHQYVAAERGRHATPSPQDPAFSWGPRLWRRLPLSLANLMGPRLVRFLP